MHPLEYQPIVEQRSMKHYKFERLWPSILAYNWRDIYSPSRSKCAQRYHQRKFLTGSRYSKEYKRTFNRSNSKSPNTFGSFLKIFRFLKTWSSTSTLLTYRTESFPRKSKVTFLGGVRVTCSNRNEQHPTVSAASSPFSLPFRRANLSMR